MLQGRQSAPTGDIRLALRISWLADAVSNGGWGSESWAMREVVAGISDVSDSGNIVFNRSCVILDSRSNW